jgi:hypothetical protein
VLLIENRTACSKNVMLLYFYTTTFVLNSDYISPIFIKLINLYKLLVRDLTKLEEVVDAIECAEGIASDCVKAVDDVIKEINKTEKVK